MPKRSEPVVLLQDRWGRGKLGHAPRPARVCGLKWSRPALTSPGETGARPRWPRFPQGLRKGGGAASHCSQVRPDV